MSTVNLPVSISPVVVIGLAPTLIEPKFDVIEPLSKEPVVTIVEPPAIGAYVDAATVLANFVSNCV